MTISFSMVYLIFPPILCINVVYEFYLFKGVRRDSFPASHLSSHGKQIPEPLNTYWYPLSAQLTLQFSCLSQEFQESN